MNEEGGAGKPTPAKRPGPVGGVRQKNREERIETLSAAAAQLFVRLGIEETSIDAISQEAGIAKGSFYRYFHHKADLLTYLMHPIVSAFERAFATCATELASLNSPKAQRAVYERMGESLAAVMFEHSAATRIALQESRAPKTESRQPVVDLMAMIQRNAIELTEIAQQQGLLRPFRSAVSALTLVGATEKLLLAVLSGEDVGPPLELPEALASIILDGLRSPS